jgi:acetoacetyl-CoA synthetase
MLWQHPTPYLTRLEAFRRQVNRKYQLRLQSYDDLHQWSVKELECFGREVWEFCGMVYSVPPVQVAIGLEAMWPRPRWFPGARMNYTENILSGGIATHPEAVAISACREGNTQWRHLSWITLRQQIAHWVSALKQAGVSKGDRIATVTTNSTESVLLLLAAGAIGAIFSSTAPDMGTQGIVERYSQIEPKLLFVDSQVTYNGKTLDLRPKLKSAVNEIRKKTATLQKIVVVSGFTWDDQTVLSASQFLHVKPEPLHFEQLPFDHPIYILFSSGTTGAPKCICHAGGAALLQQKKEFVLTSDMTPDSTYYQYTTTGWMMWNYLVGSLSVGSRIVLYDGSPLHPSPMDQLQILAEQGVTHWGTSPNFLSSLKQNFSGNVPNLDALHIIRCAGSPLSTEICDWLYSVVPKRVGLFNASGGTDLVSGIVDCNVFQSFRAGEIAAPQLGIKVEIWNGQGRRIEAKGDKGDLVITKPFFSMPIRFWGENGMAKYRKAYFDRFPGVWWHGDFIRMTQNGGYEILGRSDGVLNPKGIANEYHWIPFS